MIFQPCPTWSTPFEVTTSLSAIRWPVAMRQTPDLTTSSLKRPTQEPQLLILGTAFFKGVLFPVSAGMVLIFSLINNFYNNTTN